MVGRLNRGPVPLHVLLNAAGWVVWFGVVYGLGRVAEWIALRGKR